MFATLRLPVYQLFDRSLQLQDGLEEYSQAALELEAKVRSGDYFATVATELDAIADGSNPITSAELQPVINELLLAQLRYRVTKPPTANN